jgi:gliding motility-associated-like protein
MRCLPIALLFSVANLAAQTNQWVWMHGDNTPNQPGNYGTIGVTLPANKPSARYESAHWTDTSGNFWLYGGGSGVTRYSDLWKYEPAINMWTWMHGSNLTNQPAVFGTQGIPSPSNTPGGVGLGSATWTDLNGNLWLYGGDDGTGTGAFNDLWKYDILTNQWTWMHGNATPGYPAVYGIQGVFAASNTPGAREETSCTWVDNAGHLWLFGGTPNGVGVSCNDLWQYDIATNQWAWMKGSNVPNQPGIYGTQGISAPANTPGGRWCYTSWKDGNGDLWLFGGIDAGSLIGMGFFNDLWKYEIATNQWTWMKGSNTVNQPGVYGTKCVSAPSNVPGARGETRSRWTDDCGNFWLLGGRDLNFDLFNDLWKYNVAANEWTWISGDNIPNQAGVFGTITVPAPTNKPGARMGAASWRNSDGLWLFGGYDNGELNDLWNYIPESDSAAISASPVSGCFPLSVNFSNPVASGCGNSSFLWDFGDPASGPNNSSTSSNPVHIYNSPGNYTATLIMNDCSGGSDTISIGINVASGPAASASVISNVSCNGANDATALVSATGGTPPFLFSWNNLQTNDTATNLTPGNYTVIVTDSNGCTSTASIVITQPPPVTIAISATPADCDSANGTATATASGGTPGYTYSWSDGQVTQTATGLNAGLYSVTVTDANGCIQTQSVTIGSSSPPVVFANASPLIIEPGDSTQLNAAGAIYYQWIPATGLSCDTCASTFASPADDITYCVIGTDSNGCSDTACLAILVEIQCNGISAETILPNAFSPNNDGMNDQFCVPANTCIASFDLKIYDRWGELVFESSSFDRCWDGSYKSETLNTGVFVYYFEAVMSDGSQLKQKGNISLLK